jgi:ribosomal protein L37E
MNGAQGVPETTRDSGGLWSGWYKCPRCGKKKLLKGIQYEEHDDERMFQHEFENCSACGYSKKGESTFAWGPS